MLVAHLPAGYLLARRLVPRLTRAPRRARKLTAIALVAAVLPDIDLLYFYLFDDRQTLHHDYWTHVPAFWLLSTASVIALVRIARAKVPWAPVAALLAGVFLHMVLDTATGGVAWLYPYDTDRIALIDVPVRFDWWVWNVVLHWSFVLELAILAWTAHEIGFVRLVRRLKERPDRQDARQRARGQEGTR